jgi:hypothetical protein
VQVDPAQAELKTYWHQLDEVTQALLKNKCADGEVYQHVVLAQPATEMAHLNALILEKQRVKPQYEDQFLKLKEELSRIRESEEIAKETLKWTANQLENHKLSIAELKAEILTLQQSTSWKITAPLRKLIQKIST